MKALSFARALALAFSLFALTLATPAAATEIDKDFQEEFDVQPGVTLLLEHGDGDVTITPWDKDIIDVEVRYHVEYSRIGVGTEPDFDVEFEQTANTVRVSEHRSGSISIGVHSTRQHEYTYTILAPSYVQLDLRGDDGSVAIASWGGDIDCTIEDGDLEIDGASCDRIAIELSDGDARLEDLQAELSIECDDGDVRIYQSMMPSCRIESEDGSVMVRRSAGAFEIDVSDGDVELEQVTASRLEIMGDDGDFDLDLLSAEDVDWDIESSDGDITLHVQQGTSATFSISTDDGGIRVDLFDESAVTKKKRSASGEIGDGDGRIQVRTEDGDITLREVR